MREGLRVGVLGASGPLGAQLLSMLAEHPHVADILPFSRAVGEAITSVLPGLRGLERNLFVDADSCDLAGLDALISAIPSLQSVGYFQRIAKSDCLFIDISSDYRVQDSKEYRKIHGKEHPIPEALPGFRCVVPEINGQDAAKHKWLAVSGCNSTAITLALYPLLKERLIEPTSIIADVKVSSSAGGARLNDVAQLHRHRTGGVRVHRLLSNHRHAGEIVDFMRTVLGVKIEVDLNTYSVDMVRGILASCYFECQPGVNARRLHDAYRDYYRSVRSVRIVRQMRGAHRYPNPTYVCGTNYCDIGFQADATRCRAVALSAIDNLLKGGAGTAMQLFNLHFGFPESLSVNYRPVLL